MYLKLVFSFISLLGTLLIAHEAGYGLEEVQVWGTLPFTYLDLSHAACFDLASHCISRYWENML